MLHQLKKCLVKIILFQIELKVFRKNYPILRSFKSTRLLLMMVSNFHIGKLARENLSSLYLDGQRMAQNMSLVLFDHVTNDWRDVIRRKLNIPTAIFSGDYSNNLPSQRWMKSIIKNSVLYTYTKGEQGDHFLMFKNPIKFTNDLRSFLEQ